MLRDKIRNEIAITIDNLHWTVDKEVEVVRTSDPRFGDFTTNLALRLYSSSEAKRVEKSKKDGSRQARTVKGFKQSPMEVAKILADSLKDLPYIEKLEVKEPGFINFFIKPEAWQKEVEKVLKEGPKFGSNNLGEGKGARVEFVSANPTGPLHFGNARGGPIGDAIASVLEFNGWEVLREYIDNDRGNQVLELGRTLASRAGLIEIDEESLEYRGEYTKELAVVVGDELDNSKLSEGEIIARSGELGVKLMFEEIIRDCDGMGIKFDYIVHESDLQNKAGEILSDLEKKGFLKKAEGAIWFAPRLRQGSGGQANSKFLKDRDAVVVKSDGSYTYFTADIVYHKEKFESGYDLVIDVFGSNTFGHVPKLKALAEAYNFDLEKFAVILYQFVRIKRGDEVLKMSKRAGNFITAREVLEEVGRDALRFFILMHDANTHMDFDLELARKKSSDNPVFYVQYAHARICSILAKAKSDLEYSSSDPANGGRIEKFSTSSNNNYALLTSNIELDLIKQISRFPELVLDISKSFAVNQLTNYTIELADSFHKFYENCTVISEDEELTKTRLALCQASKITLANALKLLGVSAPEKM